MSESTGKVLLDVRNLSATVAGVQILKGIDFTVRAGEVHAIMGPNGSGKSTFSKVLAGHPSYEVTGGEVEFDGQDLLALPAEVRARIRVHPVSELGEVLAIALRGASLREGRLHFQDETAAVTTTVGPVSPGIVGELRH